MMGAADDWVGGIAAVLGTPRERDRYVRFRVVTGLCCSRHCPKAWHILDKFLSRWGTRVGDRSRYPVLVEKGNARFLYEHHESGAEIAAYVALGTSCVLLAKAIIELVRELCKGFEAEPQRRDKELVIYETYVVTERRSNDLAEREIFRRKPPLTDVLLNECADALANSLIAKSGASLDVFENVEFYLNVPGAQSVKLAGDFNDWCPQDMQEREHGTWVASVSTTAGTHLYKFVVDGVWIIDPDNPQSERDDDGNVNAVRYVEPTA